MSIIPEGGWGDLSPREKRDVSQAATGYTPTASYLMCKVCDRGTLSAKKVFRLSGPAVAIGYILLIPSVLGMIFCALMFAVIFAVSGQLGGQPDRVGDQPIPPVQSAFDAAFRQNCMNKTKQLSPNADLPLIEEYCECGLSTYKETDSETSTRQFCLKQLNEGKLAPVSADVAALYSSENLQASSDAETTGIGEPSRTPDPLEPYKQTILRVFGSGILLAMGIGFFVSGLLGWLLVMKKHVLKCNYCGAVVNAS